MKDFYTIWNSLIGQTYGAVRTNSKKSDASVLRRKSAKNFYEGVETNCDRGDDSICGKYKSIVILAFLGLIGLLSGSVILAVNPYDIIFKWKLVFGEGGEIYQLWKDPPVELYLKVYLWNVTNKEAYMNGTDDKLKLQEVGPYVYREMMTHENVTFNANGTLTAVPKHPLIWSPEKSKGRREDDVLVLPNIALLSIANVVSDQSYFTKLGLNLVVRQTDSQPLVEMTAKEFMFGYSSTLMTLGNKFMPSWIYFDKLGLIDRMYEFEGDYETVYTGEVHGIKNIGQIEKYRGLTKIPQWESPCGDISGSSDGTKFPGYIQPEDKLLFFRKSMCRAKNLIKVNETVSNGFKAYVYNFDPDSDDNGRTREHNKCFCNDKSNCMPKGLLDVHGCYYGFPIALSYPHFLDGDDILSANVTGMNPDPEKHKSYFVIQPESGLPIELAVRYQINMALKDIKTIANCERFNDMVLPLLWTDISLEKLPDTLAVRFKLYLNILPTFQTTVMYVMFVMFGCFIPYAIYKLIKIKSVKINSVFNSPWIEDELVHRIERKLSTYISEDTNKADLQAKELEVFIDNLAPMYEEHLSDA